MFMLTNDITINLITKEIKHKILKKAVVESKAKLESTCQALGLQPFLLERVAEDAITSRNPNINKGSTFLKMFF